MLWQFWAWNFLYIKKICLSNHGVKSSKLLSRSNLGEGAQMMWLLWVFWGQGNEAQLGFDDGQWSHHGHWVLCCWKIFAHSISTEGWEVMRQWFPEVSLPFLLHQGDAVNERKASGVLVGGQVAIVCSNHHGWLLSSQKVYVHAP